MSITNVDSSGIQMSLPAKAENVAVVRHAIAGLAERIGMDEPSIADLKTVVTEACMNVVVHAYPEDEEEYEDDWRPTPSTSAPRNSSGNHFLGNLPALVFAVNRHAMGGCF